MKTHEQLGITFAEYGALLGTRAMLAAKVLVHDTTKTVRPKVHKFNMDCTAKGHSCGTVGCIGGTMALIMGHTFGEHTWDGTAGRYVETKRSDALQALFYPYYVDLPGVNKWEDITPAQAIRAIDNFLNTGDPDWTNAVKRRRAHAKVRKHK